MSDLEKISIYVPKEIEKTLNADALGFEVFKRDGITPNKNRFLSMLICGYDAVYTEEISCITNRIVEKLTGKINAGESVLELADSLIREIIYPVPQRKKDKHAAALSLKPVTETEPIINRINHTCSNDSVSKYLCRMLASYCKKAMFERERIVFRDNFEIIQNSCVSHCMITFTTIWNPKVVHEVLPYSIVVGSSEMYNYLICSEFNEYTSREEVCSYRLSRITNISRISKKKELGPEMLAYLRKTAEESPEFAINSNEDICVLLNERGKKLYNRIYQGRPRFSHIEASGNKWMYHFNCSGDQVFLYFRRFDGDSAEIIFPLALRQRMIEFHKTSLSQYETGN